MIPDFRTYIGESVWSDMHRRSNGSQERKEDSLDNMTLQGFYDYWHKRYNVIGKTGRAWKDMECMNHPIKKEHVFSTPIEYTHCDGFAYTYCIEMSYDYRLEEIKDLRITYYDSFILDYPDFRDVFGPEYDVNENGIILIVNGKYKFHHYIDIIDKCVSMVKKPYVEIVMNESVWSDMHRRSNGKIVRKEDDINHMNFDTFADYIKDNYSEKGDWFSIVESSDEKSRHIEIDIISGIDLSFNVVDGKIYNILIQGGKKYVDVSGLKKIFNVNILGSSTFSVAEKDWTKSNNTFVKLIEFFLEKKTNESVWSDMHRRSNGSQIRKEDMNDKEFHKYLKEHYKVLDKMAFSEIGLSEYGIISVPILYDRDYERVLHSKSSIRLISGWNNCLINYISVDGTIRKTEIYEKFKDTFDLDDTVFVNGIVITPKGGGKLTPKFFLEVVDFFVDNANKNEKLLDRI